jgi:hypothetical protein
LSYSDLRCTIRRPGRSSIDSCAGADLHSPQHQGAAAADGELVFVREDRFRAVPNRRRAVLLILERSLSLRGWESADAKDTRAAELHACFGATNEPARQHFYAEVKLGSLSFHGIGECLAVMIDFPETGLVPVHCQLALSGLPAPYVGGPLTTNTITSKAAFGGDTDPPGYTQASIATIRLWKSR